MTGGVEVIRPARKLCIYWDDRKDPVVFTLVSGAPTWLASSPTTAPVFLAGGPPQQAAVYTELHLPQAPAAGSVALGSRDTAKRLQNDFSVAYV